MYIINVCLKSVIKISAIFSQSRRNMPPFKNIVFFTMRHLVLLASLFLKAETVGRFLSTTSRQIFISRRHLTTIFHILYRVHEYIIIILIKLKRNICLITVNITISCINTFIDKNRHLYS